MMEIDIIKKLVDKVVFSTRLAKLEKKVLDGYDLLLAVNEDDKKGKEERKENKVEPGVTEIKL